MNTGDKKKEQWAGMPVQPESDHQEINRKSGNIHFKNWTSLVVFSAVILILGLFFFYISTYISSKALRGLGIMAGTLVMSICMDFAVIKKRGLPIDEALSHYKQQLITYYEIRKYMHFIMAPFWLAAYIYGFAMLLSVFEQELLGEFYAYIIYLSWVVFFGLVVLIGVQLRKELELLKKLIADNKVS